MHRLVFITDLHLLEGERSEPQLAADLREVCRLEPRPELLVFGGDVCLWSAGALESYRALLRQCPIPVLHVMGNHDTTLDVPDALCGRDFEASLGPVNAYRRLAGVHVVVLNTCDMDPAYAGSRDWRNVRGRVRESDLEWLRATLRAAGDEDVPLLVFVHIPLYSTYPRRRQAGPEERAVWLVANRRWVVEALRPFRHCVVLQGHLHENEHRWVGGVHFVSVGAIAGAWWSRQGFAGCPDGSPRGYAIADVEAGRVSLQYRAAGRPPAYQACTFAHRGRRYVNVFFGDARRSAAVRLGGRWVPLRRAPELVLRGQWTSAHVWELPPQAGDGPVTVRASAAGRQVRLEAVPFERDYMNLEGPEV